MTRPHFAPPQAHPADLQESDALRAGVTKRSVVNEGKNERKNWHEANEAYYMLGVASRLL
jgi:hypothetical protein